MSTFLIKENHEFCQNSIFFRTSYYHHDFGLTKFRYIYFPNVVWLLVFEDISVVLRMLFLNWFQAFSLVGLFSTFHVHPKTNSPEGNGIVSFGTMITFGMTPQSSPTDGQLYVEIWANNLRSFCFELQTFLLRSLSQIRTSSKSFTSLRS